MNISIRIKLLVYMIVSIILFAVLLFGSNTFFAEKYYIIHKKNSLIENSKKVCELIAGKTQASDFEDDELIYTIDIIEKSIGGTIIIGTSKGRMYYPLQDRPGTPRLPGFNANPFFSQEQKSSQSAGQPSPAPTNQQQTKQSVQPDNRPKRPAFGFQSRPGNNVKGWEQYDEDSFFFITTDPNYSINTLRYQKTLENGLILLLWVPMAAISESASISNNFTAIIGLITIIITGIWTFFISSRFTRPITEINRITKKIAELDFSQTLQVDKKDEIGQLCENINHLSMKLNEAIGTLNSRNKQLEQDIDYERKVDKMRREFVSNVSHELKTPIFLIQGYAEGLKDNVADNEKMRSFYCSVIMDEAEKMDTLVRDLLDLSHIESGMFSINRTEFNFSVFIMDIISKYERILVEKDIKADVTIDGEPIVYADPVRIEQVIVNFMNNAIDHIDYNNKLKLTVKPNGNKIRVSVYNSGQPIPEESLGKIWSSFYKVDQARTRNLGGTGLGLSIVRAIMEAHANEYGVTNLKDGVIFWFQMDIVQ